MPDSPGLGFTVPRVNIVARDRERAEDRFDLPRLLAGIDRHVRFAYQPIVAIATGEVQGFEALLRGQEALGFARIPDIFDAAAEAGHLLAVEERLRARAIDGFATFGPALGARLFLNLDNRALTIGDGGLAALEAALVRHGLGPQSVCLEIAEAQPLGGRELERLPPFRARSFALAIDDFGTGHSGLRMLYETQPEQIKIDRFFIAGIAQDNKRKLFLSTIVDLAHVLGISVVAEGVESEAEFLTCKEIGCDLAQGYFIGHPTQEVGGFTRASEIVAGVNRRDRRRQPSSDRYVRDTVQPINPIALGASMAEVLHYFQDHPDRAFVPVVDAENRPRGVIREALLKPHIYAPYGKDLIAHRRQGPKLAEFLDSCPICDVDTDLDKILETFAIDGNQVGVVIAERGRYLGVLDAAALLQALNERNLAFARDQNPLTRLPGNNSIGRYLGHAVEVETDAYLVAYFDLDHFKPFNDQFGFRVGDRAIQMLADLLRTRAAPMGGFVGHVGGDDFFLGLRAPDRGQALGMIDRLLQDFAADMRNFYDDATRSAGFTIGLDREGRVTRFPLLACSAAIGWLPEGVRTVNLETVSRRLAALKKDAKQSPDRMAIREFSGEDQAGD